MFKRESLKTASAVVLTVAIVLAAGCQPPGVKYEYSGYFDADGNCLKYGDECHVFSVKLTTNGPERPYIVDARQVQRRS